MEYVENTYRVPVLETLNGRSAWLTREFPSEARGGMFLSPRIDSSSLRLRQSKPGYFADWHVAGEPVLIIVQRGTLRIGLRDGKTRDFSEGEAFIAADRVPEGQDFDPDQHGHTAKVVSATTLRAVHIKLSDI